MAILDAIISRVLAGAGCRKTLSGDGITSPDLTIRGIPGVFESLSIDAKTARKSVPAVADACGIAKNLDEYQFLICSHVPSLPDSDPSKQHLQKYRVGIAAAFASLVRILKEKPGELGEWNRNARSLLEETSEAYLKARANENLRVVSRGKHFEFFGVPEEAVDAALGAFYED